MSAPLRVHEAFGLNSQEQQLLFWDDFLGDQLDDRWAVAADPGGIAVVVDAQTGGVIRFTTDGDINDEVSMNWNNIRSLLVQKNVCMEVRLKLNSVTNIDVIIALRQAGDDNIQFRFDTAVDGNWHAITEDGGVPTNTDTGVAATTDYTTLRIETRGTPSVLFYIDGVLEATHTTNVPDDAGDYLNPRFTVQTLENGIKTADMDYVVVRQER